MSDSNMIGSADLVVGTAGHIDHGKTELIRALTGMDTDRLAEEKQRGISIDLGFAHLQLADGRSISFIDVPGHERFVRNMLAGVAGMHAVLLIISANELIKPQTREHLEICRLLGIDKGLVVLTKSDLVSRHELDDARAIVANFVAGSFLTDAPVIAVSSKTGVGLDELKEGIAKLARSGSSKAGKEIARLPIDRSFTLRGFGTVVTGTLWAGSLKAGDTVRIFPRQREARIRGLQVNGRPAQAVEAGRRTAVNLTGIDSSAIRRGSVLVSGQTLEPTSRIQVSLNWLAGAAQAGRREDFLFHLGTAEITAHLKPLSNFAEIILAEPVIALPGDRFVLRRPSPSETVAGGVVIDPFPPSRLSRSKSVARLAQLQHATLLERLELLVSERENGRDLQELARLTGRFPQDLRSELKLSSELLMPAGTERVVSNKWRSRRRRALLEWLTAFHAKNPALPGAQVAATRFGLEAALYSAVVEDFGEIRMSGDLIALASHTPRRTAAESAALARVESLFREAGYQPPSPAEVQASRSLVEALIKDNRLVRVSDDLVFHTDVIAHIRQSLAAHRGRRFSVPDFKEWTKTSRKHAIPLLEYLDRQHVTQRQGDLRIVL